MIFRDVCVNCNLLGDYLWLRLVTKGTGTAVTVTCSFIIIESKASQRIVKTKM